MGGRAYKTEIRCRPPHTHTDRCTLTDCRRIAALKDKSLPPLTRELLTKLLNNGNGLVCRVPQLAH
jgi:hypothetical protein